jgi:hypothetical protein
MEAENNSIGSAVGQHYLHLPPAVLGLTAQTRPRQPSPGPQLVNPTAAKTRHQGSCSTITTKTPTTPGSQVVKGIASVCTYPHVYLGRGGCFAKQPPVKHFLGILHDPEATHRQQFILLLRAMVAAFQLGVLLTRNSRQRTLLKIASFGHY